VFVNLFGFSYVSMVPVIGEQRLGLGAVAVGVLMSAEGFGALIGSLCVAAWVRTRHFTVIYMLGSTLYLAMILAFSLSPWYTAAIVLLFTGGLGIAFFGSMQSTLIFFSAIPRMRTRIMGVLVACIGAGPVGVLHVGLLAEWLGAHQAVTIIAVEGLVALAVCALIWPELRRPPELPTELRE
jgi:predicted MFS family arabinose efflux permease